MGDGETAETSLHRIDVCRGAERVLREAVRFCSLNGLIRSTTDLPTSVKEKGFVAEEKKEKKEKKGVFTAEETRSQGGITGEAKSAEGSERKSETEGETDIDRENRELVDILSAARIAARLRTLALAVPWNSYSYSYAATTASNNGNGNNGNGSGGDGSGGDGSDGDVDDNKRMSGRSSRRSFSVHSRSRGKGGHGHRGRGGIDDLNELIKEAEYVTKYGPVSVRDEGAAVILAARLRKNCLMKQHALLTALTALTGLLVGARKAVRAAVEKLDASIVDAMTIRSPSGTLIGCLEDNLNRLFSRRYDHTITARYVNPSYYIIYPLLHPLYTAALPYLHLCTPRYTSLYIYSHHIHI